MDERRQGQNRSPIGSRGRMINLRHEEDIAFILLGRRKEMRMWLIKSVFFLGGGCRMLTEFLFGCFSSFCDMTGHVIR